MKIPEDLAFHEDKLARLGIAGFLGLFGLELVPNPLATNSVESDISSPNVPHGHSRSEQSAVDKVSGF